MDCRNPISLLYLKACRLAENPTLDVTDTFLDCLPHLHQYIKGMKQKCGPSLRKILPGRVFHDRRADLRMCFRKTKTLQRRKGRSKSNLKARQLFRQVIRNVLFRYRLVQALEHLTPITRQRHLERIEMLQTMLNPQQISAPDGDFTARNVAWVHNVLGILYARNNNMEESLRHMDSAVSLDHREGLFHFNRGNVLHRTNQLETAIQEYTTALGVDPQFFKAQMNLATVNVLVGQVDAAFPMAQEAIVLMGNADAKCQASMYYNLANLFFLKQQPERAIKYFTDSIQLDALFETFTNRGAAYNQLGKLDLALQDYNKALELNPNCWESLVNRSRLHIGNSNCYLASKDIKLAHSIQPTALTEKLFHFCRRWQNSIRVAADDIARAMKQNFKHLLHYPGLSGTSKLQLTFQRRAGDCAGGVQVFKRIGVSVRTINLDTSGDGIIKLVVDRDIQGAILTMDVPDNCTLYLTKVARSVVVEHRNQVRYSHRNNRPAELRGLFSTTIQNLDRYIFVTSARRLKWGVLENYNDTHAEFVWTPKSTTVIPQAKVFNAFELQRHLRFDQDTVVMKFKRPDRPECQEMPSIADSSFEEIDARHIQLSFEKHVLQANGRDLSFWTLRNCELKFISISRTISINSAQILRKIIRYGMTQELMKTTRLRVGLDKFELPLSRRAYHYIETLSELPPLPFEQYGFIYTVFRRFLGYYKYIIPKEFRFVLHTVGESRKRDIVSLTFRKGSANCRIEFYQSSRLLNKSKGIYLHNSQRSCIAEMF